MATIQYGSIRDTKPKGKCPTCAENMCKGNYANKGVCQWKDSCTCVCQKRPAMADEDRKRRGKCPPCAENTCKGKYAKEDVCQWKDPCRCVCRKPRVVAAKDDNEKGGKCPPCAADICKLYRAKKDVCQWRDPCTCVCQESRTSSILRIAASVTGGLVCVAAGVSVTVLTVGIGASVGGAIMGAGTSLVTQPIAKALSRERMQNVELLKDAAVGATVGALTGGIGAFGGSLMAQGATTTAKVGIQMAAGAAAGGVGGAVTQTARAIEGEEVSLGSFAKSMAVGAVCGTVGGAAGQAANGLSSGISNGFGKAVTRVAVQTASATATDAGVQLCENGGNIKELDVKRLAVTATGQLAVGTTAECARNQSIKSGLYKEKLNKIAINGDDLTPQEKEWALERANEANKLPPETVEAELQKAKDFTDGASKQRPAKIGENNAHSLWGDRTGQIALDVPDENGNRGGRRVILDYDPLKKRFVYSDYTDTHDYDSMRRPGEMVVYDSSVQGLGKLPENHFWDREDDEDEKKEK